MFSGCFSQADSRFDREAMRPAQGGFAESLGTQRSTVDPRHGQNHCGHQAGGRQDVDTQVIENLSPTIIQDIQYSQPVHSTHCPCRRPVKHSCLLLYCKAGAF
jgi:hypothetical protein